MIEQELQRKIEDFRELGIPPYVVRQGKLHLVDHMVSTVIGARRSGKTTLAKYVLKLGNRRNDQGAFQPRVNLKPILEHPFKSTAPAIPIKLLARYFLR